MLTAKDLMEMGFKPGPELGVALKAVRTLTSREEAIGKALTLLPAPKEQQIRKPSVLPGSVLEWLTGNGKALVPPFVEGRTPEPSNSEIRRLLENRSVLINGFTPGIDASMDNQWPIWQLIFFHKGERRCTLVDSPKPTDACEWFSCEEKQLDKP